MRTTSTREGSEIALPKRISTILDSTKKWLHHKKKELHTVYIAPPTTIFGHSTFVPHIKYVCYDVMDVMAQMLVDTSIVGAANEFFKFEAEYKYMLEGGSRARVFSDPNTADFFQRSQRYIRSLHGKNVHILPFILSYDKTTLSRNDVRQATPMYVSLANLT